MKKFVIIILFCVIVFMPHVAYADVIIGPEDVNIEESESNFFRQNQRHILNLARTFVTNGDGGSVAVKSEPGAIDEMTILQNGILVYMQYSCLYDGDFWGFSYEHMGWIRLDQMLVLYDYVAFEKDNIEELYLYYGDFAELAETRAALIWPWPGADAPMWTIEGLSAENFGVEFAYRDSEGREWGFVTYLYGSRNIWICLSEPMNRDIPAFNSAPEPSLWDSDTEHVDIRQYLDDRRSEFSILIIIIALVATLVVGTTVLIRVFWKSNDNRGGRG